MKKIIIMLTMVVILSGCVDNDVEIHDIKVKVSHVDYTPPTFGSSGRTIITTPKGVLVVRGTISIMGGYITIRERVSYSPMFKGKRKVIDKYTTFLYDGDEYIIPSL